MGQSFVNGTIVRGRFSPRPERGQNVEDQVHGEVGEDRGEEASPPAQPSAHNAADAVAQQGARDGGWRGGAELGELRQVDQPERQRGQDVGRPGAARPSLRGVRTPGARAASTAQQPSSGAGGRHRSPGQDCDGTCSDQVPMRSLPVRLASSLIGVPPRPTDRSMQGHHGRSSYRSGQPEQHPCIITVKLTTRLADCADGQLHAWLPQASVPSGKHQPRRLALLPVWLEPPRRRRSSSSKADQPSGSAEGRAA